MFYLGPVLVLRRRKNVYCVGDSYGTREIRPGADVPRKTPCLGVGVGLHPSSDASIERGEETKRSPQRV